MAQIRKSKFPTCKGFVSLHILFSVYNNYFSEEKVQRRKEVEDYEQLVGKQDYYYPAKS